jgi:hypothetical protein
MVVSTKMLSQPDRCLQPVVFACIVVVIVDRTPEMWNLTAGPRETDTVTARVVRSLLPLKALKLYRNGFFRVAWCTLQRPRTIQ